MHENEKDLDLELEELLQEIGVAEKKEDADGFPLEFNPSGIPLDESEIQTFSFEDEPEIKLGEPTDSSDEGEFPEEIFKLDGTSITTESFTSEGLSEDLRKQMLFDATLKEGVERTVDSSEFNDLISDILSEQEEMDTYSHFEPSASLTDALKEQFESERQQELLDVNNNILSIQNEEEEITEFILCEGIYSESFKIFVHTSPLVKDGNMPLVILIEGEYILFRRINPEPKVIKSLLKVLPNFKFTYVTPNSESPLDVFSCIDKCEFTN